MTLKSRPITYEITDKIVSQIVNGFLVEKDEQLKKDSFDFAERVYKDVYKSELKKISDLPDGYLPERGSICVQFSEGSDGFVRLLFQGQKRILDKHTSNAAKLYENDDELTIEFFNLQMRSSNLKQDRKTMTTQLKAVVNSHNTTKQLKDAWPEIKKYVEPFEIVPEKRRSLAPIINDLNKKLQLGEK